MRKILPFAIILSILFISEVKSQSSFHAFEASSVITGDTTLKSSHVNIVNTGSNTLSVKVSMDNFSANPNHVTYFCWGVLCYPPTVTVSYDPVLMAPGDTSTSFIGYLHPSGYTGISSVTYNFFDMADESDSVSVTFTYDITIGIDEPTNEASISGAYPNPTNNLTRISYDLKSSQNARLVFYNILGSAVKEVDLNDKQGTLILSTSGFESGIYYYSIIADGKILPAKKLVVAHR